MKICYTIPIKSIYYTRSSALSLFFFAASNKNGSIVNIKCIVGRKFVLKNVRMTQETITAGNCAKKVRFPATNLYVMRAMCVVMSARVFVAPHFDSDRYCMADAYVLLIADAYVCPTVFGLCKWVGRCGDRLHSTICIYILWQSESEQWTHTREKKNKQIKAFKAILQFVSYILHQLYIFFCPFTAIFRSLFFVIALSFNMFFRALFMQFDEQIFFFAFILFLSHIRNFRPKILVLHVFVGIYFLFVISINPVLYVILLFYWQNVRTVFFLLHHQPFAFFHVCLCAMNVNYSHKWKWLRAHIPFAICSGVCTISTIFIFFNTFHCPTQLSVNCDTNVINIIANKMYTVGFIGVKHPKINQF